MPHTAMQSMQAQEQENGRARQSASRECAECVESGRVGERSRVSSALFAGNKYVQQQQQQQITAAGRRASASTALNMKKRRRPLTLTLSLSCLLALYLGVPPLRPLVVTFVLTLRRRRATRRDAISPLSAPSNACPVVSQPFSHSVSLSVSPSPIPQSIFCSLFAALFSGLRAKRKVFEISFKFSYFFLLCDTFSPPPANF